MSKYPHLSRCCQQTHRAPTDKEVDVWLDGRQRKSVRRMTLGQAALNEIFILNLQAVNVPCCGLSSGWSYCADGIHMEARQLEKGEDVDEGT